MVKLFRRRPRRVLIDIDTQYDLIYRNGEGSRELLCNIRRLIAWARVHKARVISTTMTCRPDSVPGEETEYRPICIEGTPGHKKIRYTMLPSNIQFYPEDRMDISQHVLWQYHQVIFEKRTVDPFDEPRADRLLSELKADEFIVFGTGLEKAVLATVLGLLQRNKHVLLAYDAIACFNSKHNKVTFRKMIAKGAELTKTALIAGQSNLMGNPGNQPPGKAPD